MGLRNIFLYIATKKLFSLAVVQDIVSQMFDSNCIQELFRPQRVLSMKSLRIVFTRLAHASIMKLNSSAMEKVRLHNPNELIPVTVVVVFVSFCVAMWFDGNGSQIPGLWSFFLLLLMLLFFVVVVVVLLLFFSCISGVFFNLIF